MPKIVTTIIMATLLATIPAWVVAAASTPQGGGCTNETIDDLAKPYQLQYRPSLSTNQCGLGGLTNFSLFGGSGLSNTDFSSAICSAVRAKIQPYVDKANGAVGTVNNATSGLGGSGMSGSGSSVIINNFNGGGTTSNLNQLFQ